MNASAVWARLLVAAIFWLPAFAASAQDARPEHPLDALTALGFQLDSRWTKISAADQSDSAMPAADIQSAWLPV